MHGYDYGDCRKETLDQPRGHEDRDDQRNEPRYAPKNCGTQIENHYSTSRESSPKKITGSGRTGLSRSPQLGPTDRKARRVCLGKLKIR